MTTIQRVIPDFKKRKKHLNDGFRYELVMIAKAVKISHELIGESPAVRNMCEEAVLVHTRTLFEFFNDDMISKAPEKWKFISKANDYMAENPSWTKYNKDLLKTDKRFKHLKILMNRVNPEVMHLSYDRVLTKKTNWDLDPILFEVFIIVQEFLSKCDKKYIGKDLKKLITQIEKLIKRLKE